MSAARRSRSKTEAAPRRDRVHQRAGRRPGDKPQRAGGLLVKDGIIADIGQHLRRNAPDGCVVIDCKGHVLAPGLIDARCSRANQGSSTARP